MNEEGTEFEIDEFSVEEMENLEKQRYQRSDLCSYCWEANDLILVSLEQNVHHLSESAGDAGIQTFGLKQMFFRDILISRQDSQVCLVCLQK